MSDQNYKDKLKKEELELRRKFYALMILQSIMFTVSYFLRNDFTNYIALVTFILPTSILTYSFNNVIKSLKTYHKENSSKIRIHLCTYYGFDLLQYIISIIFQILSMFNLWQKFDYDAQNTVIFLFPVLQAFGLCFFKSSQDPIAGISIMFYHQVVSIN